jgi:hypothetical protein
MIRKYRGQCDKLEASLHGYFRPQRSEEAALEQARFQRVLQTALRGSVSHASSLRARSLRAEAHPRLLRDLSEVIRRFQLLQREIDRRLTLH